MPTDDAACALHSGPSSLSALSHSRLNLRADQDLVDRISYSDRYSDDEFEYRYVLHTQGNARRTPV